MNFIFIIAAIILLLAGMLLLWLLDRQNKAFGSLGHKRVYQDAPEQQGKILYAKTINLCGKPDYIIKKNGAYIPVEDKPRSQTPTNP